MSNFTFWQRWLLDVGIAITVLAPNTGRRPPFSPAKRVFPQAEIQRTLQRGVVIPACPLALNANRWLDKRRQRALLRYYFAAGAGAEERQVPLGGATRLVATFEGGVGAEDWLGKSLAPGKHTIVFDFKYDGPGLGKGGTGVLTVDGKVLAKQKMEHTIPFLMSLDESLDIGMDTRTPVDESYKLPFKFTRTINKVTYKIGPEQLTAKDREEMQRKLATAHD